MSLILYLQGCVFSLLLFFTVMACNLGWLGVLLVLRKFESLKICALKTAWATLGFLISYLLVFAIIVLYVIGRAPMPDNVATMLFTLFSLFGPFVLPWAGAALFLIWKSKKRETAR